MPKIPKPTYKNVPEQLQYFSGTFSSHKPIPSPNHRLNQIRVLQLSPKLANHIIDHTLAPSRVTSLIKRSIFLPAFYSDLILLLPVSFLLNFLKLILLYLIKNTVYLFLSKFSTLHLLIAKIFYVLIYLCFIITCKLFC